MPVSGVRADNHGSHPSLGSALIAAAHAHLWSSFRRHSESPLLACRETKRQEKVSCLFGSCRLFPGLPPSQLWCANPFRLCSRSQPQSSPCDLTKARASAHSPRPPRRVSRQASWAGECWSAPILCAGISLLCPPHPCGCALLHGSEASPLSRMKLLKFLSWVLYSYTFLLEFYIGHKHKIIQLSRKQRHNICRT